MKHLNFALFILLWVFCNVAVVGAVERDEGILVGRISYIEGTLLRYIEQEKDWVDTIEDAPFGPEDALYSADDARAEFIMPNGTWIRINGSTQLQLIALHPEDTTVDVASGIARFYNKCRDGIFKVTTPFGYVVAPADTVFDLYVGDESLEVIAVRGDVEFVHEGTDTKYEVNEGSFSLIVDHRGVAEGNGTVDADWDDWNAQRENVWSRRIEADSESAEYLPEPLREEAYTLDENGRWENVYYDGTYYEMWRPSRVDPDWQPFTAGRWTLYYGDNCWIPDEPFGYVTHHYGSWVYVDSARAWYWAPPVIRPRARVRLFNIGFGWSPGRVGWIHSGTSVGWVPLAPMEIYYGYRHWGHRTVLVGSAEGQNINIGQYRYLERAVIIDRENFYRGHRYTPHLKRHFNKAVLLSDYRTAPSINKFTPDTRRFSYNNRQITRKPHASVISRINTNQKRTREYNYRNKQGIERDLKRINTGMQPVRKADIHAPKLSNKMVDADKVFRPVSQDMFTRKVMKPKGRERQLPASNGGDSERQSRSSRDQGRIDQAPRTNDFDVSRRIRSPRDTGNRDGEPATMEPQAQQTERGRSSRDQGRIDQAPRTNDFEVSRRIRSPRDTGNRGGEPTTMEPQAQQTERRRSSRDQGRIDQAPRSGRSDAASRTNFSREGANRDATKLESPRMRDKILSPDRRSMEQPPPSQGLSREAKRSEDQSRRRQQEESQRAQQQEIQKRQQQQQQQETQRRQQQQPQQKEIQRRQQHQQHQQEPEKRKRRNAQDQEDPARNH